MEWLRISQDGITQIEELNNMLELFEQILEELEIAIYNAEDKVDIICNSILAYNKKELGDYINDFELYNDNYIKDTIMNFIENNMYEIDEDYLFLELEKLLDYISDSILDSFLAKDKNARVAYKTVAGKGEIFITGEISSTVNVNIEEVARNTIKEIGYFGEQIDMDYQTCNIIINVSKQSPDIAQGVYSSLEKKKEKK